MECYLEIYWKFNCMDVVIVYIFYVVQIMCKGKRKDKQNYVYERWQ